ncbi:sulfite exporter TauE/SafE family protein [Sporomusa sphaeroides DSM 2875]|uniref:urease accessory protein UreH domain-containing protein n=1 Tax=Sporomusa sphaeroides TaxID=47679 RepID=UPI00202DE480|nr:sulfite exporter TauE/SafE family protein [Sporomusa sphaeroides]MCM0757311.1 sulfite exporter TauE/SafE family protein [Sporomusa sphaeroides DSM 2875]
MSIMKTALQIGDMQCRSCEKRIEQALQQVGGVVYVKASYTAGNVRVKFDTEQCTSTTIKQAIHGAGYTVGMRVQSKARGKDMVGMLLVFLFILFLGQFGTGFNTNSQLPGQVTYLLLFAVGLLTSLHCVGMCGGIMLSQSVTESGGGTLSPLKPSLAYNAGRLTGYTLLGGIVGAVGSVVSLSLGIIAGINLFAGIFMILMGLNLAGFNFLRKYLKLPLPSLTSSRIKTPYWVGVVNGLMPCGPLQTMQLYALGTGSAAVGAMSMFVFALGTLPLMLACGTLTSLFSKDATARLLRLSGVFVIVLGIVMTNRGLALVGVNTVPDLVAGTKAEVLEVKPEPSNDVQIIRMTADRNGYQPTTLYVQKGIPVKWIIEGKAINSCNNEIVVPTLQIKKKLTKGENMIEFIPPEGDVAFSCWMGMIRGVIKVVDGVN